MCLDDQLGRWGDAAAGLSLKLPATPLGVRHALGQIAPFLLDAGVSPNQRDSIELALAEVLNNVVDHAYRGAPNGKIELSIRNCKTDVICTIRDRGQCLPISAMTARMPVCGRPDHLPEGGFGWPMIRTLTHDLRYLRRDGENCLSFRIAAHA